MQKILRKHNISIEVTEKMRGGKFGFNKETGEILIINKEGELVHTAGLVLEHYYEGVKKRVLSRLIAGTKSLLKGLGDLDFLTTYDVIYIIDTNKLVTDDNSNHHITSFLRCSVQDIGNSHRVDVYERVGYFHFVNLKRDDAEKVGWINLFNQSFFQEDIRSGLIIGIIVDAYLGQHCEYNARTAPIADGFFLTKGVTLMYAKADNRDTLVNHLIRASDRLANDYKDRFLSNGMSFPSQESSMFDCENYWFLNEVRKGMSLNPNIIPKSKLVYNKNSSINIVMEGEDSFGNIKIETKNIL